MPVWIQKIILASEEMNGRQFTKEEIAERNSRTAVANALLTAREEAVDDDEPDEAESDEDDEAEEPFDLGSYTDEDFRDPSVVKLLRETIEDLPVSNAEKINQFRELNRLVHRAQVNAMDPDDDDGADDEDDDDEIP